MHEPNYRQGEEGEVLKFNMKCNTDNLPVPNAKKIKLGLTQPEFAEHDEYHQQTNQATKGLSQPCLQQQQKPVRAILNDKYFRPLETGEFLAYKCPCSMSIVQTDSERAFKYLSSSSLHVPN